MSAAWIWTLGLGTAAIALAAALWALFWDRSRGRLRCPKCWYDLAGREAPVTCPECGRAIARQRQMRRTRRRWRVALAALSVAGAAGWLAPVWATKGWIAGVPQPALDVVIQVWFAERAAQTLRNGPVTPWDAALVSWEVRRGLASLTEDPPVLPERPVARSSSEQAQASSEIARAQSEIARLQSQVIRLCAYVRMLQSSQPPHLRRGLSEAMALAALKCRSVRVRSEILDRLVNPPDQSRRAADSLWELAAVLEQPGLAKDLLVAICEVDPKFPPRSDTEACLRWFERHLQRRDLAPPMWREMVEATVRFDDRGLAVVERVIWRSPQQDLAEAVRFIDLSGVFARGNPERRRAAYAAICRLSEHPDVEVRRACVAALIGNTEVPGVIDALRRLAGDEDPWVAGLAAEAVQRAEAG